VTSAATPETAQCAATYTYNSNGDLATRVAPAPNQALCTTKVTTTYSFDALHRLTGMTYSNGNPSVTYYYDQTSYNGLTITNGKGRRTGMSDGSGYTAWSYDAAGRVLTERQTIGTVTKTASYSYNLDGSMASVTYPSGRTVSYDIQADGRPSYAKDTANSVNYALNTTYAPHGGLSSVVEGQTGTFSGITLSAGYNNRLLPTSLTATSTNGTAMNLGFSYFANGNVQTVTNNRNTNRTESVTYDSLNRVSTAQSAATSGADCWGQSIPTDGTGYDRYGNLMNVNVSKCSAQSLSISVDANNHVGGDTYDAAGEVTNDGLTAYTFDAEGRMTAAGSTTYTMDGDGKRVKKSSGTLYWYGVGASVLAETDSSGNTTNEYIYFAGRTARRDGSGNVYYYFADQIGSSRAITNATGSLCYDADFYPLGGERTPYVNTCAQNYKFAGMERDPETGNDHTMFRQYASNLGRWMSPDPLAGDVTNPQSLNRYAYVMNNPTSSIDPLGLDSFTLKDLNPPPHPTPCGNTNCAWQYYKGSVDELFNFGGPGGWDKFDLAFPTVCNTGDTAGCEAGFDPNGAAVADQIAALTYNTSNQSWWSAFGSDLNTNFASRFSKSCFGQFITNTAAPLTTALSYVKNIPANLKIAVSAVQSGGFSLGQLTYAVSYWRDIGLMTPADAEDMLAKLGTAAAVANTGSGYLSTAAGFASAAAPYAVPGAIDFSMLYGDFKEWQAVRSGACE
jgi:RHS repeat-associated protein